MKDAILMGGSWKKLPTSKAAVSFWFIPNGCDYDRAEARVFYFDSVEAAEQFASKYHNPPEMAVVIPVDFDRKK